MDRALPTRDSNGPASIAEREGRARGESTSDGTASGGKVRLGDNPSRQLGPLHRGPGYESRRVFLFCSDLRWFAPTHPSPGHCSNRNSSSQQQSVRYAAANPIACCFFSCDCMFWGERGGGRTRQPVGPSVDTAIMTTVLSTNRVDSRSFSSRGCAFRRKCTSTGPYSATLYPTCFTLDSLHALTIRAQRKTHGWCFTSDPMACGGFFV